MFQEYSLITWRIILTYDHATVILALLVIFANESKLSWKPRANNMFSRGFNSFILQNNNQAVHTGEYHEIQIG